MNCYFEKVEWEGNPQRKLVETHKEQKELKLQLQALEKKVRILNAGDSKEQK